MEIDPLFIANFCVFPNIKIDLIFIVQNCRENKIFSQQLKIHFALLFQVLMIHERSNSINLRRIEAFLESPDNMPCYAVNTHRAEEPWFIEHYGLCSYDCRNLTEAVVCPFCRLCNHEMNCYCSPPDGYCCKHLHAIKRFLKVQFIADEDNRFGDEIERKDPDWLLLEAREEREIKRQSRRNRSYQIQNIDLTWTGKKDAAENVTQNQFTFPEPVVIGGSSTEDISQGPSSSSKIALQNEGCLSENGSKKDEKKSIGHSDSSKNVAACVETSESKIPEATEDLIVSQNLLNTSAEVSSENSRFEFIIVLKTKLIVYAI